MSDTLLSIEDLSVRFGTERGQVQAVDGVSLHVNEGETLAIVGESAGQVDRGRIVFEGQDLVQAPLDAIRRIRGDRIAMIFQEPMSSLNPVLTIGKQVAEPIWQHRQQSWKEAYQQAGELLQKVAIPDAQARLKDYPHQFSGGMRQRVMIAMALACQPRLIIADEPTTALDVTVQAQILDLLKNLTKEMNSSLILITHDLGVVARYADRVAVMYGGRIVESASAARLYKQPKHPYTQGLMNSIPTLGGGPGARLNTIVGQPPDLANLPAGCAFHPRCAHAQDACTQSKPLLAEIEPDHHRACFGYD
jgi:oligopeptide transport system ATP-binding protein